MAINLMQPPYLVEVGPCPGVYFSKESYGNHLKAYFNENSYGDHLKLLKIQHPLGSTKEKK